MSFSEAPFFLVSVEQSFVPLTLCKTIIQSDRGIMQARGESDGRQHDWHSRLLKNFCVQLYGTDCMIVVDVYFRLHTECKESARHNYAVALEQQ